MWKYKRWGLSDPSLETFLRAVPLPSKTSRCSKEFKHGLKQKVSFSEDSKASSKLCAPHHKVLPLEHKRIKWAKPGPSKILLFYSLIIQFDLLNMLSSAL